jgi:hypothetical protein
LPPPSPRGGGQYFARPGDSCGSPRRDLTQRLPDLKLKRRAAQIQRQGKRLPVVIKMGKYLRHPLTKNLVARMQPRIGEQAG